MKNLQTTTGRETNEERARAVALLIFIVEKRAGWIEGCTYADGRKMGACHKRWCSIAHYGTRVYTHNCSNQSAWKTVCGHDWTQYIILTCWKLWVYHDHGRVVDIVNDTVSTTSLPKIYCHRQNKQKLLCLAQEGNIEEDEKCTVFYKKWGTCKDKESRSNYWSIC